MNRESVDEAARLLWTTWSANGRIQSIPPQHRPASRADGYQVQARIAQLSGQTVFGWKIAATSKAGQKHIGVDGPLAGRLLAKRVSTTGSKVSLANNIMLVAEAEFAFRMARDLPPRAKPYSEAEVFDAVESLHPAIEIPDSRYEDFVTAGAAQLIADNACASYFVIGPATVADWRRNDLASHVIEVAINGKPACEGKGENVLGSPRIALTWIANELSLSGDMLRAGQTVTTGTCIVPAKIAAGDAVVADFGEYGRVEAKLTE